MVRDILSNIVSFAIVQEHMLLYTVFSAPPRDLRVQAESQGSSNFGLLSLLPLLLHCYAKQMRWAADPQSIH